MLNPPWWYNLGRRSILGGGAYLEEVGHWKWVLKGILFPEPFEGSSKKGAAELGKAKAGRTRLPREVGYHQAESGWTPGCRVPHCLEVG